MVSRLSNRRETIVKRESQSIILKCFFQLLPLLMSVLKLKLLHTVIVITSHGKQTGKELSLLNHPDDPEYQKCEVRNQFIFF